MEWKYKVSVNENTQVNKAHFKIALLYSTGENVGLFSYSGVVGIFHWGSNINIGKTVQCVSLYQSVAVIVK